MLLACCGIDPAPYLTSEDFRGLLDFSTPSTLSILGSAVVETAAMCLSVIARAVRGMQATPAKEQTPPVPLQLDAGERYTLQGKWELSVVGGDADSILYRFLDLPEQGPASASRKDFEQWLAAGFVQPVTAAILAWCITVKTRLQGPGKLACRHRAKTTTTGCVCGWKKED